MNDLVNGVVEFFRVNLPVRTEIEWGAAVSFLGTAFCYLVGGWDALIEALLVAMVIDYITGLMAARINPALKLSSRRGGRGILKKVMILSLIALAHIIDNVLGQNLLIRSAVTWFYLGNEGLSIIENAANSGLPIPRGLKNSLEQLIQEKMEVRTK